MSENTNFYKLMYKIDYSQNMKLSDFIEALQGLENEYKAICIQQAKKSKTQRELLKNEKFFEIAKIREGSVEFELVNTVTPLFADMNTIHIFSETIKNIYSHLIDPSTPILYDISKKCLENLKKIVFPISSDKSGKISIFNIIIGKDNTVTNNILEVDYKTALAIQDRADTLIAEQTDDSDIADESVGVYMYWDTARAFRKEDHTYTNTGKICIEILDKKAYPVTFEHDDDWHICTSKNDKFGKEWQYLMYKVDVNIIKKHTKIVAYEITKVYPKNTIEPEE